MDKVHRDIFLAYLAPMLSVSDLCMLACTCHALRKLADDNEVWRVRYHAARKRMFRVGPSSVHLWPKVFDECTEGLMPYQQWQQCGMPCNKLSHYARDTLQEYGHTIKFHFFKRMYAKHKLSRLHREAVTNTYRIRRYWEWIRMGDPTSLEFIEHWRMLRERVNKSMTYIILANKYAPILALPAAAPSYLNE
jgi:hypothetical protein